MKGMKALMNFWVSLFKDTDMVLGCLILCLAYHVGICTDCIPFLVSIAIIFQLLATQFLIAVLLFEVDSCLCKNCLFQYSHGMDTQIYTKCTPLESEYYGNLIMSKIFTNSKIINFLGQFNHKKWTTSKGDFRRGSFHSVWKVTTFFQEQKDFERFSRNFHWNSRISG